MSDTVIKVEHLSKHYNLGTIGSGTLYRDFQSWWARTRGKEDPNIQLGAWDASQMDQDNSFWALKDVSFEVKQGDVVGIIGRNGAGKSTLLKILSRVTGPTSGNIKIKGRVASLLEVGTGFHPELTGRENVYLNGTILGMRKAEIDKKFDEIVEFAEIEKFIDTPVKRYSSGMYVRLAFAVAAHLDPEILIVDEVLAVGDATFQKKCLGKMGEVSKNGRTVLFVSHNLAAVNSLCNRGVLLNSGNLECRGEISKIIKQYNSNRNAKIDSIDLNLRKERQGTQFGKYIKLKILKNGVETDHINIGDDFVVEVEIDLYIKITNPEFGIIFGNEWNNQLIRAHSWESWPQTPDLNVGKHTIKCNFYEFPILQGQYNIHLWLGINGECWDFVEDVMKLTIEEKDIFSVGRTPKPNTCICYTKHNWYIEK